MYSNMPANIVTILITILCLYVYMDTIYINIICIHSKLINLMWSLNVYLNT